MSGVTSSETVVIVVIPRDRFSTFPPCLEALYAYTHVRFRVIVVAGGTDNATKEYLRQLQVQKGNMSIVLVDRLLMQGEARNLALRQANERFCIVLENDTIVRENWIARVVPPHLGAPQRSGERRQVHAERRAPDPEDRKSVV